MTVHAKLRPPSSSHRWLSCPGSVNVMQLYPNDPSVASQKGDVAHDLLNTAITFGVVPTHQDIDLTYSAMFAYEKVMETHDEYKAKGKVELHSEITLDIHETGEIGTTDIIFVTDTLIHIIDFKNGYVPVEINKNPQIMLYLCGAISRWGERKKYKISVIQPNYPHRDGLYRHYDVDQDTLDWFKREVQYAMMHDHLVAGKHCKTSYCPHRGACEVFLPWAQENLKLAWSPSEFSAMTDDQLAEALDQIDTMQGWHNQLRGEALRRMTHLNRNINGFKVVRARQDRDFADATARAKVYANLEAMGVPRDALYDRTPISVAGVERIVKALYKPQGRAAWVDGMEEVCPKELLLPQNHKLTVESVIDGRKPYRPGAEFTPLKVKPSLMDIL